MNLTTLVLLVIAVVLAGVWWYQRASAPVAVEVPTLVTPTGAPPEVASPFSAVDQDGKPFTFQPGNGKVTAVFFGFTNCKDTCPLTLSSLGKARQQLPREWRDDVQVILVSLDPERDTPERLKTYLAAFDEDMIGLHVAEPALKRVAQAYGVAYEKGQVTAKNEYEVFHTSATYVVGRDGKMRLMYSSVPSVERLVQDFTKVLRE